MKLIVHFMDGEHIVHDFAKNSAMSNWYSWRVAERTLIVLQREPIGSRVEYPLVNVRLIEVETDAEGDD